MKDYYKTLELNKDAQQGDIKRAYFAMVRKFPPDRYPDDFMKIREAYEVLSNEATRKQYDSVESMPDIVKTYFNAGKEALECGDYTRSIKLLERVTKVYPDFTVINSLLGDAYSANGNSGKAIQIFEELVRREPKNAGFAGKLAEAYKNRGWHKKAIDKYITALKLDEDNISLWLGLSECYYKDNDFSKAKDTIFKALEVSKKNGWDNLELYYHIIQIDIITGNMSQLKEHIGEMKEKSCENDTDRSNVTWFLANLSRKLQIFGMTEQAAITIDTAHELMPEDAEITSIKEKIKKESKVLNSLRRLQQDSSIDEIFTDLFDSEIHKCDQKGCVDCELKQFDIEMGIIIHINELRKEIHKIRDNYPELYDLKADFFGSILDPRKERRLFETYNKRLQKYMKEYPEFFENDDEIVEDDEFIISNQPVIREEEKVGRNDPCPCGSGKKYKKCCG
jgi:tetratricopeptide (TPR) repeat protein